MNGVVQEFFHMLCPQGPLFLVSFHRESFLFLFLFFFYLAEFQVPACLPAAAQLRGAGEGGGLPWGRAGRPRNQHTNCISSSVSVPKGPLPGLISKTVSFAAFSVYSCRVAVGFGPPEPRMENVGGKNKSEY